MLWLSLWLRLEVEHHCTKSFQLVGFSLQIPLKLCKLSLNFDDHFLGGTDISAQRSSSLLSKLGILGGSKHISINMRQVSLELLHLFGCSFGLLLV